jgi:NADH:ubiquinone oxidoreductase subunit E
MASCTVTPEYLADAASACHSTAIEIQKQLDWLRDYVLSADARLLGMTPARFHALMTGYDIYVQMLNDALTDIACGLARGQVCDQGGRTWP